MIPALTDHGCAEALAGIAKREEELPAGVE